MAFCELRSVGFFESAALPPSHSSFFVFYRLQIGVAFLGWASFDRRRRSSLDEIRQKKVVESSRGARQISFSSDLTKLRLSPEAKHERTNGRGRDGGKTALAFCYQCQSSGTRFRPVYITRANGTLKFRVENYKAGG